MLSPTATVPVSQPDVPDFEELRPRFERVLSSGMLTCGPETERLERVAADVLGVPECVAVSSCTAGLMLVFRCLGLTGEVILPSLTFFASGHSLLWNGIRPVFADCDPSTFQIDPASIERNLTRRTGGILGVHLYGAPAPAQELEAMARRQGVSLVFDGAHALGAETADGRPLATYGDAVVYSLSPTKPVTSGEGGLIATRRSDLANLLRQARNYGKGETYDCRVLGLNARLSELQAVLGEYGFRRLREGISAREKVAQVYEKTLHGLPGVRLQAFSRGAVSARKDFAVVFESRPMRDAVAEDLARRGIETRRYFDPPLHRQVLYRQFYEPQREPLAETDRVSDGVLCLPIFSSLDPGRAHAIAGYVARRTSAAALRAAS